MQYVYHMQKAAGFLSPACQAAYGADAWKCIMAPHATKFVSTPWFALQSRTDSWQLGNIAMNPCAGNTSRCNATEWKNVQDYVRAHNVARRRQPRGASHPPLPLPPYTQRQSPKFMEQFSPYMTAVRN